MLLKISQPLTAALAGKWQWLAYIYPTKGQTSLYQDFIQKAQKRARESIAIHVA